MSFGLSPDYQLSAKGSLALLGLDQYRSHCSGAVHWNLFCRALWISPTVAPAGSSSLTSSKASVLVSIDSCHRMGTFHCP